MLDYQTIDCYNTHINLPIVRIVLEGGLKMQSKECIAMILAGGKGERLGSLTNNIAKPGVYYGGKYRIIDFALSNCTHSGIDSLGVLTQYKSIELHDYIGNGQAWGLNNLSGGVYTLPASRCGGIYSGTANAVYQNIDYIEKFNPEHVLIMSGNHIYNMNYEKLLDFHKKKGADITLSVVTVPLEEAPKLGNIKTDSDKKVLKLFNKQRKNKSNFASMGIYLFKWSRLKGYLAMDRHNFRSEHDFAINIIPAALASNERVYAYEFEGYWKDVSTVHSLWESNMDLIKDYPPINLYDNQWRIFTRTQYHPPCYVSYKAEVRQSIVAEGCHVYGKLSNSVLFDSVTVGEGAEITDSVLMPGVVVGRGAKINKSVIGNYAFIGSNAEIGADKGISSFLDSKICSNDISLIGPGVCIGKDKKVIKNSHINEESVLGDYLYTSLSNESAKPNSIFA